jgi:hypothetical protein
MNPTTPEQLEFVFEPSQHIQKAQVISLTARLNAKHASDNARLREAILVSIEHLTDAQLPRLYK